MADKRRTQARAAERLPEEAVGDADVATAMAEAVLDESDERQLRRDGEATEHRTSRDATAPPG